MTTRVPMMPTRFSPRWLMASLTGSSPLISGKGEIGSSSLMQKWPPIEVTAAASAPAPFKRATSRAKISACRSGRFSLRLRLITATSA
jgi:hypothetical protein